MEHSLLDMAVGVLGFLGLALLVGYVIHLAAKRNRAMRQFCIDHGLEFRGRDDQVLSVLAPFVVGHRQCRTHAIRSISGRYQGMHVVVLDLYETALKQSSVTQTVVCISSASLDLPRFMLVPHEISHVVNAIAGTKSVLRDNLRKLKSAPSCADIDISDCPAVAVEYALRGTDKAAVRRLLTPTLVELLRNIKSLCIEGCGNRLIMWREGHGVSVEKLMETLDEATSIYEALSTGVV